MKSFDTIRKCGHAAVALAILAVASTETVAADKKAKAVEDWQIRGTQGSLMSNTAYALFNITNSKYLYYKFATSSGFERVLTWDNEHKPRTEPKPRFEFVRLPRDKSPAPLKYGDAIAIVMPNATLYQGKPAPLYLVYKKQEKGINLGSSMGTTAEWEIQGGPTGTPVPLNAKFRLYNKKAKDFVVYAERENGINLNWNGVVNPPRDHRTKK